MAPNADFCHFGALETAKKRLDANVNFDLAMELLLLEVQENG